MFLHNIIVHGNGVLVFWISKYLETRWINSSFDHFCICPGVLPQSDQYFPLAMFKTLQSGSFGTQIITYGLAILLNASSAFILFLGIVSIYFYMRFRDSNPNLDESIDLYTLSF